MQKLIIAMLGVLLSITGTLYAQKEERTDNSITGYNALSPEDRLFSPAPYSIGIDYRIDLGRGNKLEMNLANGYDFYGFQNLDSLVAVFLGDLQPLRDSLADPMTVKRIDYLIDTSGRKKLRLTQYRTAGTAFLLDSSGPALLKIPQDTINILLIRKVALRGEGKNINGLRYDRIRFFLNRYSDLDAYAGGLNATIHSIQAGVKLPHDVYSCGFCYVYRSPIIKSRPHFGNGLMTNFSIAAENYRNYFVPSFAISAGVVLNRDHYTHIWRAFWEPLFLFGVNAEGQTQIFRNDLIGVGWEQLDNERPNSVRPALAFGWIAHSEGNYFSNKPAFTLRLFDWRQGALRIQPGMNFDGFFRRVSPSIRVSIIGL